MRETLKKISFVMKKIFGWGMLISLAIGAIMFFGYVVALIIGGDIAAAICYFLYEQLAPVLIYATSILILLGLVAMYLGGEAALSGKKKEAPKRSDTDATIGPGGKGADVSGAPDTGDKPLDDEAKDTASYDIVDTSNK